MDVVNGRHNLYMCQTEYEIMCLQASVASDYQLSE